MKLKVYYRFITIVSIILSAFITDTVVASQNRSFQSGIQTVLEKAILNYAQMREPETEFDVELLSVPATIPTLEYFSFKVSSRKKGDLKGKTLFSISYQNEKGIWNSVKVWAKMRRYCRVLILLKNVDKDQIMSSEDLIQARREVTWSKHENPATLSQAVGKRAKRRLLKGRILTNSMLETIPVVERGHQLSIHVYSKNLSLILPGIACENGGSGDIIKVRNPQSGTYFKAEIQDSKNAIMKL